MRRMVMSALILGVAVTACAEPPTNGANKPTWKPDELHLRTGIYLDGIPAEAPEDKLYPMADNLSKLDEYQRLHGIRLEAKDLPRFERAYQKWGYSDGVFNVPEWVGKTDEWDVDRYRIANNNKGELVPLSKAEIMRNRVNNRPYFNKGNSIRWLSTPGQLVKQCDGVFVGEITKAHYCSAEDKERVNNGIVLDIELTFRVETNLFGRIAENAVTISFRWGEGKGLAPTNGMRLLVFYARGFTIHESTTDTQYFRFNWAKPPEVPSAPPAIVRKKGSYIRILNSPETENAYIEAVGGYLRLLRLERRDPDKYYKFLRPLVNSPVWRIRQDAKEDMLGLVGPFGPARFDYARIADDPELNWDLMKDYMRYVVIPDRQKEGAGKNNNDSATSRR